MTSEPTLYRREKMIPGKVYRYGNDMVPVEPDYKAMVEAGRKANIDLVPEECEMLWRAGIGGDDGV